MNCSKVKKKPFNQLDYNYDLYSSLVYSHSNGRYRNEAHNLSTNIWVRTIQRLNYDHQITTINEILLNYWFQNFLNF